VTAFDSVLVLEETHGLVWSFLCHAVVIPWQKCPYISFLFLNAVLNSGLLIENVSM